MAQISRYEVKEEVLDRLQCLFFDVVAKQHSKENFLTLLNELLSPTERIMLSKRIGIIYLLEKGVAIHRICKALHMSTSTVAQYILRFRDKKSLINQIVKNVIQREKVKGAIKDVFSEFFIQPGIKKGHHYLKYNWDKEKERREEI
ncbi:helix-turn-helix domain-containing protein [Candidatus Roizmanbacteria bacterium]|nr:helix-turn-helix domain-containing protein [Candidatus Roizmanbacteria bacterium]